MARQLLIYPMLDDRTTTPGAISRRWPGGRTTTTSRDGTPYSGRDTRSAGSVRRPRPGRLADATGLPPAYIEVGQLDVFRDEDIRYALTLGQCGVPVELRVYPGMPHEYDAIAFNADVSRRASRP